jgi:opacity protein-like surface antigen
MPRCLVYVLSFACLAFAPVPASAASEDCPDGWFCEPNAAPGPAPASEQPAPAPSQPPQPPARPSDESSDPAGHPGPPQPGSEREPNQGALEVPDHSAPKQRRRRGFREWGFNLHLLGALLDNRAERVESTALGGLGFGFRYRLLPRLAFEADIELLKRTDHNGYSRSEGAVLLNALVFFNPRDVVQVYGVAGLGFSRATASLGPRSDEASFKRYDEHYSYFGGQLGLGVEVRVSRRLAIGGDLLGFVRGRTDERWQETPEYIDRDHQRSSKTSGGGLLRVGVTFYW